MKADNIIMCDRKKIKIVQCQSFRISSKEESKNLKGWGYNEEKKKGERIDKWFISASPTDGLEGIKKKKKGKLAAGLNNGTRYLFNVLVRFYSICLHHRLACFVLFCFSCFILFLYRCRIISNNIRIIEIISI